MNLEDYNRQLKQLEADYNIKKFQLAKAYAMANRTADVDDIITNGTDIILIDRIDIQTSLYSTPVCIYRGKLLKKNLTPRVDGSRSAIWQGQEPMTKIPKKNGI